MDAIARFFSCRAEVCCQDPEEQNGNVYAAAKPSISDKTGLALHQLPEPPKQLPPTPQHKRKWTVGKGTIMNGSEAATKDMKALFRTVVHGGTDREVVVKPPSPKTYEEIRLMVSAVKRNQNLQAVHALEDKFCNAMMEMAWKEEVPAGKTVIEEGDVNSDYFYIVQAGTANVLVRGVHVLDISTGGSFGELALLYFAPRSAKVVAKTKLILWVIDRNHFKGIFEKQAEEPLQKFTRHMHHMDGLEKLPRSVRMEVANALEEYHFVRNDVIFKAGDPADSFWFCLDGEFERKKGGRVENVKGALDHPVILGERSMSSDSPPECCDETVTVVSATAFAVTINRKTFDMLMRKIQKRKRNDKLKSEGLAREPLFGHFEFDTDTFRAKHNEKIFLKDLSAEGVLGVGGFGLVELMKHKDSKKYYAMKTMNKGYITNSGLQSNVLSERNCHFLCDSPFIFRLLETYSTTNTVSFLMEAVLGGSLYDTYQKNKFWGKAQHAQFYAAGVILAFAHMHAKNILYRDLKPENIAIDNNGYPKIIDFGWAKLSPGKSYTLCGSLVSMPPEMVKCEGHSRAADWWTLGIMVYELLAGQTPFQADDPMEIYSGILTGIKDVDFERLSFTADVEDLIKSLCHPLPPHRIPMRVGGLAEIKKHAWFKGFDWLHFENLMMTPPYKPKISGPADVSNFPEGLPAQVPHESVNWQSQEEEDGTSSRMVRSNSSVNSFVDTWDEKFGTSE